MTETRDNLRIVGLRYEPQEGPPQVILKASGELAEAVLARRRRSAEAPPVVKNEALLEQLYRLPVDGRIGPELYRAVAVLLAHVLDVEEKLKGESMASALDITARIMGEDLHRLNIVSQNLANAGTAGYKKEIPVARAFVEQLEAGRQALSVELPTQSSALDQRQGPLTRTANPLDLALDGAGFFELASENGERLYTRQGSFRVDAGGRLVSAAGLPVMGAGGEILLSGTQPSIDEQGRVFEGDRQMAQLRIMRFDAGALAPLGGGLYRAASPGEALTESLAVRQGFLESSNVVSLTEMLLLIGLTRRFESAQRVVQSYDGMLGTAITKLGEF